MFATFVFLDNLSSIQWAKHIIDQEKHMFCEKCMLDTGIHCCDWPLSMQVLRDPKFVADSIEFHWDSFVRRAEDGMCGA
jgi:hypothetical protein